MPISFLSSKRYHIEAAALMGELISDRYRLQQQALHRNPEYDVASAAYAPAIADTVNRFGICALLDCGSGKGRLMKALAGRIRHDLSVRCYDPAIPEFSQRPEPAEMVTCIDVLEHIEPENLEDGRNAHLIQQPAES